MKLKSDLRRVLELIALLAGGLIGVIVACIAFLVMLSTVLRWLLDK